MSSVPDHDEAIIAIPIQRQRTSSNTGGVSRLLTRRRLTHGGADPHHVDRADVDVPPGLSDAGDDENEDENDEAVEDTETEAETPADDDEKSNRSRPRPRNHYRFNPSWSSAELERLINSGSGSGSDSDDLERETYGAIELRDGFFDALFLTPRPADRDRDRARLLRKAERTLPLVFLESLSAPSSLPLYRKLAKLVPRQWRALHAVVRRVATTRAGVRLSKTFLAWFAAYVLCLVPATRAWLSSSGGSGSSSSGSDGLHAYIVVVSAVINHPARTAGSQVDGAVSTCLGTAAGLAWGALGLLLSSAAARRSANDGAAAVVLAVFLGLGVGAVAALRTYFIRLYQFVICAGLALAYACLAGVVVITSEGGEGGGHVVEWRMLLDYLVSWLVGQAICLVICLFWFPDAGDRNLATSLHAVFGAMLDGMDIRKAQRQLTRRRLAQAFVNLSQAYRDFAIDISVSLYHPKDVLDLRNLLQGVIRALLSMRPEPAAFSDDAADAAEEEADAEVEEEKEVPKIPPTLQALVNTTVLLATPGLSEVKPGPMLRPADARARAIRLVRYRLDEPTRALLRRMRAGLQSCHAVLMDMTQHRRTLGPGVEIEADVPGALVRLRQATIAFDAAEAALLDGHDDHEQLVARFVPEVIGMFAYCRPIRLAATAVEAALVKVNEMEQRRPKRPRFHMPSYPWRKALGRTGPQVRHDRGGVTATSYYRNFADISRLIRRIRSVEYDPLQDDDYDEDEDEEEAEEEEEVEIEEEIEPGLLGRSGSSVSAARARAAVERAQKAKEKEKGRRGPRIRHRVWEVLHGMQGFEMRFALKTAVVATLLALPGWLAMSRGWWIEYDAWWAVAMAWLMMHPRVGGNLQDLLTRVFMGALGAVWSGAGYAAGHGNPFVMAAFAVVYMVPMLYRFTQSSHARSGLVGCISFTVTSLALVADAGDSSPLAIAVSRGVAFVVGVVASVVINWLIWPFIARHELRKAISQMMFFLSIVYRSIIAKYVYYDPGHNPTAEDIKRSEVLEGRLREGFVRIRQLMALTRHEVRLRAPFDPRPYSALADACERFFEFLVSVRQSALFFHPRFIRDSNDEAVARLLTYRRDAVASVLTNLYVLAGALRARTAVPKYLPSAAAARKRLMNKMAELEAEFEDEHRRGDDDVTPPQLDERKRWVQIYSYSYSESLAGCVAQLAALEQYTKLIVGEQGFDDSDSDDNEK